MTDMTISFLFIVMILLAFFASQLRNPDTVPRFDYDQVVLQRDQLAKDVADLRKEVKQKDEDIEELNQNINRVKSDLEIVQKQRDQFVIDLAELQKQLKLRDEKIAKIQQQLDRVTTDLDKAQKERDKLLIVEAELLKQIKLRDERIIDLLEQLRRLKDDPIERYLADVTRQRSLILERLRSKIDLDFPELKVAISQEGDALRFMGDGLFPSGQSVLPENKRRIVESIASRLSDILPCYTLGRRSSWSNGCNAVGAAIEAIQIEGHTDSSGKDNSNVTLSTNRANETFFAMTSYEQGLVEFLNNKNQPVLSVAGYGRMRPIKDNKTEEGMAANRRIDLRIIMYTPQSFSDIQRVRDDLRNGVRRGTP